MPWRKFKAPFRYRVRPGSDSVVQFFDPEQTAMLTSACEAAAEAAGVLYPSPPEVADEVRRAHTEAVIGKSDKTISPLRKARPNKT